MKLVIKLNLICWVILEKKKYCASGSPTVKLDEKLFLESRYREVAPDCAHIFNINAPKIGVDTSN